MFKVPKGFSVVVNEALFVATGVVITIGYQWLFYQGAGGGGIAMTSVLPNYLGMLLALAFPAIRTNFISSLKHSSGGQLVIMCACFADVLGSFCTAIGLFYTGSGIYQVLYSSVVIFTALLSRFLTQKPLSGRQWFSVVLVNFGLALSASSSSSSNPDSSTIFIGVVFMLFGTVLIALAYVLDSKIIDEYGISGENLCCYTGIYSTLLTLLYIAFYTIPNWDQLIAIEVQEKGGDWTMIAVVFIGLCFCALAHNLAYFAIVGEVGSVTAGVLQALRAVVVFLVSAVLYCSLHSEQCFTFGKALSCLIVIGGVFFFTISPPAISKVITPTVEV